MKKISERIVKNQEILGINYDVVAGVLSTTLSLTDDVGKQTSLLVKRVDLTPTISNLFSDLLTNIEINL